MLTKHLPHHKSINVVSPLHVTEVEVPGRQTDRETVSGLCLSVFQINILDLFSLWPAVDLFVVCSHFLHKTFIPEQVTGNTSQVRSKQTMSLLIWLLTDDDAVLPQTFLTHTLLLHQRQQHQFICRREAELLHMNQSVASELWLQFL